MGLRNGSDEYYKDVEHAERIYRAKCDSRSSTEREEFAEQGKELADRLIEKHGVNDSVVSDIIERFYLDRDWLI